jgi:ubiquitin carboxyl-terminal hydrolase 25/28
LAEDPTLGITEDFLHALDNGAEEVLREIETLEGRLPELKRQLDEMWQGNNEFDYELVSVFMHRGKTSGAGHYWTYQAHLPDHRELSISLALFPLLLSHLSSRAKYGS